MASRATVLRTLGRMVPGVLALGGMALGGMALGGCYAAHHDAGCGDVVVEQPRTAWTERVDVMPTSDVLQLGEGTGVPHVAWDGTAWSVAWGERVAMLGRDARVHTLAPRHDGGGNATAIDADACRRGVVSVGASPGYSTVSWLGSDGVVEGAAEVLGVDADIARAADRWWVVGSASEQLAVSEVLDVAPSLARTRATISSAGAWSARVVAEGESAVIAWIDAAGVAQRVVTREGALEELRVMTANVWTRGAIESARLRDDDDEVRIAIAATDGAQLHVAITDPIARRVVAGPLAVARTHARGVRPGIATMPEHRALAVCVPSGAAPWGGAVGIDRVDVVVLDESAEPLSRAVEIGRGGTVRAVSCAWSGQELLVVWWRAINGREELVGRRVRIAEHGSILI